MADVTRPLEVGFLMVCEASFCSEFFSTALLRTIKYPALAGSNKGCFWRALGIHKAEAAWRAGLRAGLLIEQAPRSCGAPTALVVCTRALRQWCRCLEGTFLALLFGMVLCRMVVCLTGRPASHL
ncbi:MAG: hypothetical protein OXC07_05085 [Kistimonas sp.]|nr:hypothetical protein [Kistimonas sp.]